MYETSVVWSHQRDGRLMKFYMSAIDIYVDLWSMCAFNNARQFVNKVRLFLTVS